MLVIGSGVAARQCPAALPLIKATGDPFTRAMTAKALLQFHSSFLNPLLDGPALRGSVAGSARYDPSLD